MRRRSPLAVRLLVPVLLVALAILAFFYLADLAGRPAVPEADLALLRALRAPSDPARPLGPAWLSEAARDLTALGSVTVLALLGLAVSGFLALTRRWRGLLLVVAALAGGLLASFGLKALFARPRPEVVPHLAETFTSSFPSAHAMMSAVVYLTLGALVAELVTPRRLKVYALLTALALTVLVGASRVYLGVHYPSDVAAGWCAGLAWALVSTVAVRAAKRRSPALRDEQAQARAAADLPLLTPPRRGSPGEHHDDLTLH